MKTCSNCQHLDSEASTCAFHPVRVAIANPETYWCGQYRAQVSTFASDMSGPAEKVSDKEILEWFELMPEEVSRDQIGPYLASKFGITERTVKERLRRLRMLGILKCVMPESPEAGSKPCWMFATLYPTPEESRAWWSAILAQQKPRGWALLAGKGRMREWDDIKPSFTSLNATPDKPATFSDLFRAQTQLSPMGRSTFSKLLLEAISLGRVVKSEAGLYGLKPEPLP